MVGVGVGVGLGQRVDWPAGPGSGVANLLLEDGANLLLEDGASVLLLE